MKALRTALALLFLATTACLASRAQMQSNPSPANAIPGTVNYIEGSVLLNGRPLAPADAGVATVKTGQFLSTGVGRVEVLLTPGVFLRLGHNSAIEMIDPELTRTQIQVTAGSVTLEVLQLFKENMLLVTEDGVTTRIVKNGLYEFDAETGTIRTYNGRALAFVLPHDPKHPVVIGSSRAFTLPAATAGLNPQTRLKAKHFDRNEQENQDELIAWSKLRSRYLAQSNVTLAYQYAGYGGVDPGWYWNPYSLGYTWLPGNGMLWSPFGWGFYSPGWIYYGYPVYGGYPIPRRLPWPPPRGGMRPGYGRPPLEAPRPGSMQPRPGFGREGFSPREYNPGQFSPGAAPRTGMGPIPAFNSQGFHAGAAHGH